MASMIDALLDSTPRGSVPVPVPVQVQEAMGLVERRADRRLNPAVEVPAG
jgi:hypothetical protein